MFVEESNWYRRHRSEIMGHLVDCDLQILGVYREGRGEGIDLDHLKGGNGGYGDSWGGEGEGEGYSQDLFVLFTLTAETSDEVEGESVAVEEEGEGKAEFVLAFESEYSPDDEDNEGEVGADRDGTE